MLRRDFPRIIGRAALLAILAICLLISVQINAFEAASAPIITEWEWSEPQRAVRNEGIYAFPRLSPDGKLLAFSVYDPGRAREASWSIKYIRLGEAGIAHIAGQGTNHPTWFPNSDRIVYTNYNAGRYPMLVSQSIRGGSWTFIGTEPMGKNDQQPHLDAKGEKLVFQTRVGDRDYVCVSNVNGSGFTMLTEGESPRWHPTQNIILYNMKVGDNYQIFKYDRTPENRGITQLTFSADGSSRFPCWSPDGNFISYTSDKYNNEYYLHVMTADGQQNQIVSILSNKGHEAYYPEWGVNWNIYYVTDVSEGAKGKPVAPEEWTQTEIWWLPAPTKSIK